MPMGDDPGNENENENCSRQRWTFVDDISTSFQPKWTKQRSTDSSWSYEQSVTVNLIEVSRRNLVKSRVYE